LAGTTLSHIKPSCIWSKQEINLILIKLGIFLRFLIEKKKNRKKNKYLTTKISKKLFKLNKDYYFPNAVDKPFLFMI
jgi:hypothetical protein